MGDDRRIGVLGTQQSPSKQADHHHGPLFTALHYLPRPSLLLALGRSGRQDQAGQISHPTPSSLPDAALSSPSEGYYAQEADANPAIKHLPSASLVQAAAKPCWPETSACPLGAKGKCPHATRNLLVDFNTWPRDEVAPWATSWLPRKAWVLCVLGNLLWDPGLGRRMYFLKQNDEQ